MKEKKENWRGTYVSHIRIGPTGPFLYPNEISLNSVWEPSPFYTKDDM